MSQPPSRPSSSKSDDSETFGVVAAPSALDSILASARAEAARERAHLDQAVSSRRAQEAAAERQRRATERDRMQAELIVETRRRNEVLERHAAPEPVLEPVVFAQASEASSASAVAVLDPTRKIQSWFVAVAVGLAVAAGGALALSLTAGSAEAIDLPDIAGRVDKVLEQTRLELEAKRVLEDNDRLRAERDAAVKAQQEAAERAAAAAATAAKPAEPPPVVAPEEVAPVVIAPTTTKSTRGKGKAGRRGGRKGGLKIDTTVFKHKKKPRRK